MVYVAPKPSIPAVIDHLPQTYRHPSFAKLRTAMTFAVLSVLVACGPTVQHPVGEPFDPFEQENRRTHERSKKMDRAVIRPVAKAYSAALPDDIESAISRFSLNLSIPQSVVNNTLQGNMKGATEDLYRFVVNTTIGMGGIFDPATELNMPAATEADFGMTLHAWGVPQGAYLELPVIGPSTERDAVGKFVDLFTDPLSYALPSPEKYVGTATKVSTKISDRGRYAETFDSILYDSADSYAQARSLYLQKRKFELEGGDGGAYSDPYDSPYEDPYDQ